MFFILIRIIKAMLSMMLSQLIGIFNEIFYLINPTSAIYLLLSNLSDDRNQNITPVNNGTITH